MPAQNRSAYISHTHSRAHIPAKSDAGIASKLVGKIFIYGGEFVECISNPFGWQVQFRVMEGRNKGMLHNVGLIDVAAYIQPNVTHLPEDYFTCSE